MTKKMEKKYIPLAEYFRNTLQNEVTLTYEAIENIMGQQLPNAAHLNVSWWTKTKAPLNHYLAWTQSDFVVSTVNLGTAITFERNNLQYTSNSTESQFNLIIRPIEVIDTRPLINLQTEIFNESTYEYYELDEFNCSVQYLKKQMADWKRTDNSVILIALLEGEYVGFASILGMSPSRQRHVATIRIDLLKEFRHKGFGSALLEKCLIWAKSHHITRLEANIIENNKEALQLFHKFGFTNEGTKQASVKIDDKFYNECIMNKLLL